MASGTLYSYVTHTMAGGMQEFSFRKKRREERK